MANITQEMVHKLNVDLSSEGYTMMFVFHEGSGRGLADNIEVVLVNDLGLRSYVLNPTDVFVKYVIDWFESNYSIQLSVNNTNTVFWASRGGAEMSANEVIQRLDGADLFLRNRANAAPAPLNEYDTCLMMDAAEACNDAGQLIQALIYDRGENHITVPRWLSTWICANRLTEK